MSKHKLKKYVLDIKLLNHKTKLVMAKGIWYAHNM
jgi:hypothetical protein